MRERQWSGARRGPADQGFAAGSGASGSAVPTLALSARDDPVCCVDGAPGTADEVGPGLAVAVTRTGGHLGFSQGVLGLSAFGWMEAVTLQWFTACLQDKH